MIFTVDTEEKVQGVYRIEADSIEQARALLEKGQGNPPPIVYNSVETKIIRIVETAE
jgi:hypothetical protein